MTYQAIFHFSQTKLTIICELFGSDDLCPMSEYLPPGVDRPYPHKQQANTHYYQIGSIAPDLPYAA